MYEVIFTAEPRSQRNPLHWTLEDAVAYANANAGPGEDYEVWQVADDIERTRVQCVPTDRGAYVRQAGV